MSDPANVPPMQPGGGPLPRPRSRTWPIVVLGLVILVCGSVIGAGTAVLWLKPYLPPPPPAAGAPERIAGEMRARYDLNEEQARKVREIMQRSIEVMEAIHRDAQEKSEVEREKLRGEMKAVLTPEQFAQWLAQFERLGARRGPPGGPGGGPGGGPPGQGRPGMGRQGPGQYPQPGLPPGQGPGGGRPGMGGGPGPGQGPLPPGKGRGPGPEGGPMRPLPPEGRRASPGGPQPGEAGPRNPQPPVTPPAEPEAPKSQETPPGQ